jgi:hypothetical protein
VDVVDHVLAGADLHALGLADVQADSAAMRRRDKVWRSRIAQVERLAHPAPVTAAVATAPGPAFSVRRRTAPRG